jgi:hypothetical protein
MRNWGEHAPGLWTRALLRLPDAVAVLKASGEQRPEHPRSRRLHKKHLVVEPRLLPLSAPKRASPSYEAMPSSSPTQPPGASTSSPSYHRRRPSSSRHHRGERRSMSFFPLQPLNRAPPLASLLIDPFPHRSRRRLTGSLVGAASPRHGGHLPCFAQGLAAQPRLGRPEAAQVHSRSS